MRKHIVEFLGFTFVALLSYAAVHIYQYYPDKLPAIIMNYRTEQLAKQSRNLIDEILVVDERYNKHQEIAALMYLTELTAKYEFFLNDNRLLIDKNEQLKKILSEQLKEGLHSLNSKNNNEDFVVEKFNKSINSLQL